MTATVVDAVVEPSLLQEAMREACQRCMDFVFPPSAPAVNKALIRAIVYAKHGPAYVDYSSGTPVLRFRGGLEGRAVQHHEEKLLYAIEEQSFLMDIYGGRLSSKDLAGTSKPIDGLTLDEIQAKKDPLYYQATEMTELELKSVFDEMDATTILRKGLSNTKAMAMSRQATMLALPALAAATTSASSTGAGGSLPPLSFRRAASGPSMMSLGSMGGSSRSAAAVLDLDASSAMAQLPRGVISAIDSFLSFRILELRRERIQALKTSCPAVSILRRRDDLAHNRQALQHYNTVTPKAYQIRSWADPKDVLRALHRSATAITEYEDRHNPGVNLNVRCLRPDFVPDPSKPGWDPCCATRGTRRGKNMVLL